MSGLILTRRNVFRLLAAPAIIRVADMMAIKAVSWTVAALTIPWGAKLLRDLDGWRVDEGGFMVPLAGRQLIRPDGNPIAPELVVEMGNYDVPGTTMKIGGCQVQIGHVQGEQYPLGGWQA